MITLSASKITCWLQCPRKFRFRYVDRLPPPWKAAALALGAAVHATLETFHLERTVGASMTPNAVGRLFCIDLAAELADEVRFKDDESAADVAQTGMTLVTMYAAANQNVPVRAAEAPFELPVTEDIALRGVFDVLLESHRIRELKTAARDYDAGTLSRHIQVSAYSWAYSVLFGSEVVVEVVALLKLKHPRLAIHEVTRSRAELAWFVELVVEVARAIEAGVFPPNPSWACGDCEYKELCHRQAGGS